MATRPMHSPAGTRVALRTLRPLTGLLRSRGHDVGRLLDQLGIDARALVEFSASIPHALFLHAWRRAEEISGDAANGLAVLADVDPTAIERVPYETEWIVPQLFAVSATVGAGLDRYVRYFPVGFYGSQILIERGRRDGAVHVRHVVPVAGEVPRGFSEFILGLIARQVHETSDRRVAPRAIHFAHGAPPSLEAHARVLPAPALFSCGEDAVLLEEGALAEPLRAPNPTLAASLERIGDNLLAQLAPLETFADQVRAVISAELARGNPNADHIAAVLGLSTRTLARRLDDLGTSHKALLGEARAGLARRYLIEEARPVREVARLLGFSEVSAFHRAFRRWYGCSPTDYRRRAGAGG